MHKSILRSRILAQRRALSPAEAGAASALVQETFLASREFDEAQVIALYAAVHGEVDTFAAAQKGLASGKTVLLPAVSGASLVFRRVHELSSLRVGAFGIREPLEGDEVVPPAEADLIVVPGVAFDLAGRRIGYGKGYYDRTLHDQEGKGKLVGFCYDFQLVEEIVGEPHDVAIDIVFTEKRVVRPLKTRV